MLAGHGPATERLARILAWPFIALRVPPNALSVLGVLLIAIPVLFAVQGRFLLAGVTLGAVALFDTIDGTVARATNRVTRFGGFLDSVLDRVADAAILIAIGVQSDGSARWWLVLGAGLVGQYLTSYTRARAYEAGTPPASTWRQFFERPERIIFLCLLFATADLYARVRPDVEVLYWGMVVYATLTLFTSIVRVIRVYGFLEQTKK